MSHPAHAQAGAAADAALRGPVLFLATLGLAGLALATLLDLAAELALFAPDFGGRHAWANAGLLLRLADAGRTHGLLAGMLGGGLWVLGRAGRGGKIGPAAACVAAACAALPFLAAAFGLWHRAPGVAGPLAAIWSGQEARLLVLGPLGLGFALFLFPKIADRPLFHGGMAWFAFWTLLAAGGWAGASALADGPFPAWFPSVGIAARLFLLAPAAAAAFVLAGTAGVPAPWRSPAFRFLAFALGCWLLWNLDGALCALRGVAAVVRFTAWEDGTDALFLHGFAACALWGLLYYAGPRLARWEWSSPRLIAWHFGLAAVAVAGEAGALAVGGLIQGLGLLDPRVPFAAVADAALPFHAARAAALLLFLAAQGVFAVLWVRLLRKGGPARRGPAWLGEAA